MDVAQLPPVIGARYQVLRELGRGGMGAVYLVQHLRTGDQLALKVIHAHVGANPQVIERFKREAQAPARIRSEHVVKVTDADVAAELGGAPFLVMELLDGEDLDQFIERRGRIPPAEAVHILAQVARALDKAHAIGIVHRDLKPENLFLHRREDGSSILKVLDFGISKVMGGEGGDLSTAGLTSTGAIMGTPLYMAPEQARGQIDRIGPQTDIWALGLIAYRMLTGEIYWRINTLAELMAKIIAEPMEPPTMHVPWLPPAMDGWFARSCAREPEQRWRSAGEQIAALGVAVGVSAPPVAASSSPYGQADARPSHPSTPGVAGHAGLAPPPATVVVPQRPAAVLSASTVPLTRTSHMGRAKSGSPGLMIGAIAGGAVLLLLLIVGGVVVLKKNASRKEAERTTITSGPSAGVDLPEPATAEKPAAPTATPTEAHPAGVAPTQSTPTQPQPQPQPPQPLKPLDAGRAPGPVQSHRPPVAPFNPLAP